MMTFEEYEQVCKECELTQITSEIWGRNRYDYGYTYEGQRIVYILTPGDKSFSSYKLVKNTAVMAVFPLLDKDHQRCMIGGAALKKRIYDSIQVVKNWKVQEKLKDIEEDFK